jgi:hypothetical protein
VATKSEEEKLMTSQETRTENDIAPADPVEKSRADIRDLFDELKIAIDGLRAEVEDIDPDEANPKMLQAMQRVQEDVEHAVIDIESARDAIFDAS